jgi:serpin B
VFPDVPVGMLTRRDTVRLLGAAVVTPPLLAACADHEATPRATTLHLVRADVARSVGDPSAAKVVASAVGAFTLDLWSQVGSGTGNLALSPYSIAVALAMTTNGAAGETARQMRQVLHVDSLAAYNSGMAALTQELAGLSGTVKVAGKTQQVRLAAANQLFGDRGITWDRAFLTVLAKEYGAGLIDLDFQGDAEGARVVVNDWTADQTHDRIPQILPKGVVDDSTRLVLVNALYFKAPWDWPFERSATTDAPFHVGDGRTVSVPMMKSLAEGSIVYVAGRHFTGARLPYGGGRLAMTVALPGADESDALDELLSPGGLSAAGEGPVSLTMPRWSFRVPTDLGGVLRALGMTDAFGGDADFSRMTDDERLHLQFVLHQAFIAVDEEGTEAAAATAVGVADSAVVSPHELRLDRPFLFLIHDVAHGTPLFVGRVGDPS